MKKSFKRAVAFFMCALMMLSCADISCLSGLGVMRAAAAEETSAVLPSGVVAGDINGDGKVNNKDLTRLLKYLAGEGVTVNETLLDTNGDGKVNNKDLTRLLRYVSGEADIEIFPKGCQHQMQKIEEVQATCTEDGNIEYWHCSVCGKFFSEENGSREITVDETVVKAMGHAFIDVAAVPPTYEESGSKAYVKCDRCKKYFWDRSAQKEIENLDDVIVPPLEKEEYNIVYDFYGNFSSDEYLKRQEIDDKDIVYKYASQDGVERLAKLEVPGYQFDGWYDDDGNKVVKIAKGSTENVYLTAHWTLNEYTVQYDFESANIPESVKQTVDKDDYKKYTVNKELVLPSPNLDGYIFAGWSDEAGNIYKKIPTGTIGHKTFSANWLSERNQAWTKKSLDKPVIIEEDNRILFTYEIGEMRNVPVSVIQDFGKINSNGITKTVTKKFQYQTSTTQMEQYMKTVSEATTEAFGWTLSNDWSKGITVDEEWMNEHEMSLEEVEEVCRNESQNWYVSSGHTKTDTTEVVDTKDDYNLKTTTKNKKTYNVEDKTTRQDFSAGLKANYKIIQGVGAEIDGVGIEAKNEKSIGLDLKYSNGVTTAKKTGTEVDKGSLNQKGDIKHTGTVKTNTENWNSESSTGGSSSFTETNSLKKALSEKVSKKTGYGESYINSSGESEKRDFANSKENSDQYSSAVTFDKTVTEGTEETFTTSNTMTGYHRWVMVDTAHVFAVVGFDVAKRAYFVSTFSVMDNNLKPYEDYSFNSGDYDDNENGEISFEVPTEIADYVAERVISSEGLVINEKTGVVTDYNGTDTFVEIPEYITYKNLDGTYSAVKITGISANAFKGKDNIVAVDMSDYITEIPENAFENCTSLISLEAKGVTSIGEDAFKGCSSLKVCTVDSSITDLGNNAFEGLENVTVDASNARVVKAAFMSGAKNIVVNTENYNYKEATSADGEEESDNTENEEAESRVWNIPSSVESVKFNGYEKVFNDVYLHSDAAKTEINRATFVSSDKTPLSMSSENICLQNVTTTAPGIAFICSANSTTLSLYGSSSISSQGENAILVKKLTLYSVSKSMSKEQQLEDKLHVDGRILTCDKEISGKEYLEPSTVEIVEINSNEFEQYEKGRFEVTFDANGGVVDKTVMEAQYGKAYGTLPTPTRDHYAFVGWFTDPEGGEQIFESTEATGVNNIKLYAHWTQKDVKGPVLASEVPDGAEIISRKYSYTLRKYTTSNSSSMTGWTKYDTKRTSWGGTQGPVYSNPANGSRNVWSESYVSGYGSTYYWHFYKYGYSPLDYSYTGAGGGRTYYDVKLNYYPTNASQRPVAYENGKFKWYAEGTGSWAAVYYASEGDETDYSKPIYSTCWYYQEPVYTYYFYKDESKESTSYPTDSDISNIQEWVMYREK